MLVKPYSQLIHAREMTAELLPRPCVYLREFYVVRRVRRTRLASSSVVALDYLTSKSLDSIAALISSPRASQVSNQDRVASVLPLADTDCDLCPALTLARLTHT